MKKKIFLFPVVLIMFFSFSSFVMADNSISDSELDNYLYRGGLSSDEISGLTHEEKSEIYANSEIRDDIDMYTVNSFLSEKGVPGDVLNSLNHAHNALLFMTHYCNAVQRI